MAKIHTAAASGKNEAPFAPLTERLAYSLSDLKSVTGLSTTTVWRLEKRGLLRPVAGIRSKLYSRANVEAFLNGNTEQAA